MRVEGKELDRLKFFESLYEEAKASMSQYYEDLDTWYEQYKGSTKIDGSNEDASVVRNITYELIESQISSYIPNPSVTPGIASEHCERLAKSIETLCKAIRNKQPFEKMNDLDERYNPIYGGSVWLAEWDNSVRSHNTIGEVKVTCLSPKAFVGEPNIYDIRDMDYCFISFETTRDDIVRKYDVSYEVADKTESVTGTDDNSATVYVCYYKNEGGKICQFVWSGEETLKDVDDYFSRKIKMCETCGKREELCTCEEEGRKPRIKLHTDEYEIPTRPIQLSDGSVIPLMSQVIEDGQPVYEEQSRQALDANGQPIFENVGGAMMPATVSVNVPKMEETKIPYYTPDVFPIVIRKNTSAENTLFGQSDCEFIRPQQQAINKVESRIMMKLMRASVTPVIPEDATVSVGNSVFGQVIRMRPGQTAGQYGVVDTTPDISNDMAEAERLYDHAKRILGISDSFQGQYDGSAQSGRAKQLQIQQAQGRLDSKRQMKNAAYADLDKVIFQLYLAYADEPRVFTYKDTFGKRQNVVFRRHDFVERDEAGQYYYNDEFMFSADATVDIDKQRELIWQENRANFQIGAYGDPASPDAQLIYWQNNEAARYPFAHDNVERLKEIINANRAAQMREQELASMQAQNQSLQNDLASHEEYERQLLNAVNGGKA